MSGSYFAEEAGLVCSQSAKLEGTLRCPDDTIVREVHTVTTMALLPVLQIPANFFQFSAEHRWSRTTGPRRWELCKGMSISRCSVDNVPPITDSALRKNLMTKPHKSRLFFYTTKYPNLRSTSVFFFFLMHPVLCHCTIDVVLCKLH